MPKFRPLHSAAERTFKTRHSQPRGCVRAFLILAGLTFATACAGGADPGRSPGSRPEVSATGPLKTTAGSGGFALQAPSQTGWDGKWRGAFGGVVLCTDNAVPVEIKEVRLHETVKPLNASVLVRRFEPADVATLPRRERFNYLSFQGVLGSPPEFAESYAGTPIPGHYVADLEKVRVHQSCADATQAERALGQGRTPAQAFSEVVVTLTSGASGAQVDGFHIDYEVDGRSHSAFVDWTLIACGPDVTVQQVCEPR